MKNENNELIIFKNEEFGEMRILEIDNEPWFVAKDISDKLGYAETSNMMKRIDEEDFISSKLDGMNMKSILINESGLYSAILGSKLPSAKKFKKWVTSEVLPSIRKTGGYIAGEENLTEEELIEKAFLVVTRKLEEKEKQIEEMKPKVLFADSVANTKDTILVSQMAVMLRQNGIDIGEKRLFKWLRNNGYLVKEKNTEYNRPTQKSMDRGLFKYTETTIQHNSGIITTKNTPRITGKGQIYFINKFKKNYGGV